MIHKFEIQLTKLSSFRKFINLVVIFIRGRPFKTLTVPRGEGSALFSDLLTSYDLDMGRKGSKNGEKLLTS